jgi:3-hydroxyisobutyrate dehydrogenase
MTRILLNVVLVFVGSVTTAQEIERVNPEGMTQPTAYSHVVRYGELLFLAGQVAVDGDGSIVGEGDMRAQVRQVMENLKRVLASQGADFGDVAKITIYTTDVAAYRETGDIRAEYWTEGAPASTLVQIDQLARPVFLVEIEATAIAPD